MSSNGEFHTIGQGETITGLAFRRGLHWQTVWQHPNNAQLRQQRAHQNILYPGDKVFIPDRQPKTVTKATDQVHTFVRMGVPEKFNMQFLDLEGNPYGNQAYVLTVDGRNIKGNLDGDGWIRISLPPNAQSGRILVGPDGSLVASDLRFGNLDPITELSGIQARLLNLGYFAGPADGQDSKDFQTAVWKFRQDEKLSEDGGIDDDLRNHLKDRHKS